MKTITSFSKDGYKIYGKKCLEGMLKHWPGQIVAYIEEPIDDLPQDPRLSYVNLFDIPDVLPTLNAMAQFPVMRGRIGDKNVYKYDAFRFCRKVFAQCHAVQGYTGNLYWVDADTEFTANIDEGWLLDILGEHFMVYMGRKSWHSCASFVGWNTQHEQSRAFFSVYRDLIVNGYFLLEEEWHDSYWLDQLRNLLNLDAVDVAAGGPMEDGPFNVFDAVFAGKARHLKGNIKFQPKRYQQLIDIVKERQPKKVVEIGTWNGERAIQMNQASPGIEYMGFDLFEFATPETDSEEKNVKPHHTTASVGKRLKEAGMNATLTAGNTRDTLPRFIHMADVNNWKADLVYIDGGHSVETIESDLTCALCIVKKGGVIVLDDYYIDGIDVEKYGCNLPLEKSGLEYKVLPIADPVAGGGATQMAVIQC